MRRNGERLLLGQVLCDKAYLDESRLAEALTRQQSQGEQLGQILIDLGYITESQLKEALAMQAGVERVDLTKLSIGADVLALVPADTVNRYNCLPLWHENGRLAVAMIDPFMTEAVEDLRLLSGCSVRRYYGDPYEMENAILKFYGSDVARMLDNLVPEKSLDETILENGDLSADKLQKMAREPSLVNLVNLVIYEAIEDRASDIHIEPFEHEVRIKYRIDGLLVEKAPSSKHLQAAIVSRIKIMGNMNIAERFVPQDGHIEFTGKRGKIDLRVSTVPTVFGEAVVMRILDKSAAMIDLEDLGLPHSSMEGFGRCLTKNHGIVLVTGPTGCGKTTTLYASLKKIYTPTVKMITIEDPVEYQLDGINQMPVNVKRGLTFATGLRHILRHDPDIVMVGEIRDRETAEIAIRAALTGHLVFSTLHTNDAAGAITRLVDMGVEPFLLASSLEAVLAQRLVRKICVHCRETYQPDPAILKSLNGALDVPKDTPFYHGRGCSYCGQSGMQGRLGIFELLRITPKLREVISSRATTEQICKAAPTDHVSMIHDGVEKIVAGVTTPDEIFRVAKTIEEDD